MAARRAPPRRGLRGHRRRPPRAVELREPRSDSRADRAHPGRPARPALARQGARGVPPARGLQPRLGLLRAGLVGAAGADRGVRGGRRDGASRVDPPRRRVDPLLPGLLERDLRPRAARVAADRGDAALAARRDGGYAGDYVRAMWLMLQQDEPDDYVIASGESHTVEELVTHAFEHVGLDWREYVHIDESLRRGKAELHDLVGNPAKARERLGWRPTLGFKEVVELLVDAELARLGRDPARQRGWSPRGNTS